MKIIITLLTLAIAFGSQLPGANAAPYNEEMASQLRAFLQVLLDVESEDASLQGSGGVTEVGCKWSFKPQEWELHKDHSRDFAMEVSCKQNPGQLKECTRVTLKSGMNKPYDTYVDLCDYSEPGQNWGLCKRGGSKYLQHGSPSGSVETEDVRIPVGPGSWKEVIADIEYGPKSGRLSYLKMSFGPLPECPF